jgi:hypothetical protein
MARLRSEEEQKAVETILRALGHRLTRLRDDYAMSALRGEESEGISKGLQIAIFEVNGLLPRKKRLKD